MKTTYTPGPWAVSTVPIQSSGGGCVCHQIGPFSACIYDDWRPSERGFDSATLAANARLIAAAPELLEALRSILNGSIRISDKRDDMLSEHDPKVISARAAITRATTL